MLGVITKTSLGFEHVQLLKVLERSKHEYSSKLWDVAAEVFFHIVWCVKVCAFKAFHLFCLK